MASNEMFANLVFQFEAIFTDETLVEQAKKQVTRFVARRCRKKRRGAAKTLLYGKINVARWQKNITGVANYICGKINVTMWQKIITLLQNT
jgi:hypothetical protein